MALERCFADVGCSRPLPDQSLHWCRASALEGGMNKKSLTERDICTKFITPAVKQAGWDEMTQLREEVSFTKGRMESTQRKVA
jgi:hypothetical protein